jgi:hypothetical protein
VSEIPPWIGERIERNLDNTLTQEHIVETMLKAPRYRLEFGLACMFPSDTAVTFPRSPVPEYYEWTQT